LIARKSILKGGEPVNGVFERAKISALSAAVARSTAAWVTTPVDVIKTRMMLEAGEKNPNKHPGKGLVDGQHRNTARRNALRIGKEVFQNEGTRGLLIRTIWTAFGNGLYMGCYEGARFHLKDRRKTAKVGKLRPVHRARGI
jgi:solute carrier family 25 (mitochondrial S-adenosylmethionine transporter), member 26